MRGPRFRVVDLTARKLERAEPGTWKGDFVRLVVPAGTDPERLAKIRAASGARAFQVVYAPGAPAARRTEISAAMPIGDILARYVAARPAEGLDAKALLAAGRRLLKEEG